MSVPVEKSSSSTSQTDTRVVPDSSRHTAEVASVRMSLTNWVLGVAMIALLLGANRYTGGKPVVDTAKGEVKGFLSRRPFFRPTGTSPAPLTTSPATTTGTHQLIAGTREKEKDKEKEKEKEKERKKELREMAKAKAAAEKKAASEKAAAEKKAALDKAAAEKKAALDKAAAEKKAALEKAAAEKEIAEKEQARREEAEARRRVQKEREREEEERQKEKMREMHAQGLAKERERLRQAKAEADLRTAEEKVRERRERDAARQTAMEEAQREGDKAAAERLRRLEERQQLQREKEGGKKMLTVGGDYVDSEYDVAGLWRGAKVVVSDAVVSGVTLTSPWLHHYRSVFKQAIAWVQHSSPPVNKLYNPSRPPLDFFSFRGDRGTVTILLHTHAHVREMKLYHPSHDAQRAPKDIRLLGWAQDPTKRKNRRQEPIVLGHYRYVPGPRELQSFAVMRQRLKTPIAAVTLDVTSNYHHEHGGERINRRGGEDEVEVEEDNYTNVWRFIVIGDDLNQVQVV